ncbi:MAG: hypothetical protein MUF60_07560 [Vicinamibacterales bacterium]|jgi:hypothetical protein|nr:hypothetical protein [Vicinamibacterales bacterium]
MRVGHAWWGGAIAAAVIVAGAGVDAIEQRPLPAFTVTAADGAEAPSDAMVREGKWLLIYVTPTCRTCDGLLRDMARWDSAALPAATVLVVGNANHADAAGYVARAVPEALAASAWYADAHGQAREALRLQGAPVVIGMRGERIQWAIAGVLNDPRTLESALRSWVEQP